LKKEGFNTRVENAARVSTTNPTVEPGHIAFVYFIIVTSRRVARQYG